MQDVKIGNEIASAFHNDLCDNIFLASVLECIHDAVIVINTEGTVVYINPGYERELSTRSHRLVGRKMQEMEPNSVTLKVLKTGKAVIGQMSRIESLGIDIVVNSTPIFKHGVLIGAVTIFKNITDVMRLGREVLKVDDIDQDMVKKKTAEGFKKIIGQNRVFREMLSKAKKASLSDINILLLGETGTGKDLIARAIHDSSKRKSGHFIEINCAAIPEHLLESELFGYEEGAFTGARKGGKVGKFELAQGGTLFLDEIGDMSIGLQAKLLLFLQEKSFERVGGTRKIRADVRILAATNQNLEMRMREGKFRPDLYFRLNVFSLRIPPLRERKDDIPLLSIHFLQKFSQKEVRDVKLSFSALKALTQYHWPGNIRELRNIIETAVVLSDKEFIEKEDLPEYLLSFLPVSDKLSNSLDILNFDDRVSIFEKELISNALERAKNNRSKAIDMLGISRSSFYQKLEKYKIK
jgi:transcriptional regulator with PAS, ATPase and Fis domain